MTLAFTRIRWAITGAALLAPTAAVAETSSWVGRTDGPAEAVDKSPSQIVKKTAPPKTDTGFGSVKVIKTVPGHVDAPVAPATAPPATATTVAKTPPPSDDAAYEAFDQRRASRSPSRWQGASTRKGSACPRTSRLLLSGTPAVPSSATQKPCSPTASCSPRARA